MRLRHALLLLMVLVLIAGIVPAGLLLERRLGEALTDRAREGLAAAPMILKDRLASVTTVRMMHARDYAAMPGLAPALAAEDLERASTMLAEATGEAQERPVLVRRDGRTVLGPGPVPESLVEATRRGEMPVSVVSFEDGLHLLALAPVTDTAWMGAVGGSTPFADAEAATLAGLTRSEVMVVDGRRGVTATTGAPELARAVARNLGPATETVAEISLAGGERLLVTAVALNHGRVVFVRDLGAELAILPDLQRTALASTVGALAFALLVGALFAHRLARPVAELADAAEGFAAGRPEAPLGRSALLEVRRLSEAFTAMRRTLAARLSDLERANRALEDRQRRLAALQAEVVQRERLATSGRLLAQLAHEIRNPVASVRNCLEIVRRQGNLRGEAREFAEMAVSELLRMHELAERMLDLHRPRAREAGVCDAGQVARDTVQLLTAGEPSRDGIDVVAAEGLEVRIAAEALKQVLLNLVLNAREAAPEGSTVEVVAIREHDDPQRIRVEVLDRGPGIPGHLMDRIFDPFFTTKDSVHGVGLGLYTAESLVRAAGGVLRASNRADGPGARFSVILPAAH